MPCICPATLQRQILWVKWLAYKHIRIKDHNIILLGIMMFEVIYHCSRLIVGCIPVLEILIPSILQDKPRARCRRKASHKTRLATQWLKHTWLTHTYYYMAQGQERDLGGYIDLTTGLQHANIARLYQTTKQAVAGLCKDV